MRRPPRPVGPPAPHGRAVRPRSPGRREVGGAPVVLPGWLDTLSDRWWGLTPRRRTLLGALAVAVALTGTGARALSSPHGAPVTVLVATDDLPAGTELEDGHLRRARWPAELVPDAARSAPTGTLRAPLPAGAVLSEGHVTDRGLGGLVEAGHSAVPLPAELVPALAVGTSVQVVATAADGAGAVLADDAEVVADDGTSLWLAVPEAAAADVAAAGLRGAVALAVNSGVTGDDHREVVGPD